MTKEEFDDYFKVLDKAGDRLRNIIYVFTIVFTSMLIYGISSFAYPASQYTFDSIDKQARCHANLYLDADCAGIKEKEDRRNIHPPSSEDDYNNMIQHQLDDAYDDSVKVRSFSFPVFGFQTDRDLLWILFPFVGIFGYYILLLALDSVIRLFQYLMEENVLDGFRLRLIQSTLVITTPLKRGKRKRGMGDLNPVIRFIWLAVATLVCSIPMIVSAMIVLNQINFLPFFLYKTPGELFFDKPSMTLKLQLAAEGFLILVQLALLIALVRHARDFGTCQKDVETHIAHAPTPVP